MCPVSWTLYGLVVSQFGDLTNTLEDTGDTVEDYIRDYFGYRHDFLGAIAAAMIGFTMLFAFVFAISIKILNFRGGRLQYHLDRQNKCVSLLENDI